MLFGYSPALASGYFKGRASGVWLAALTLTLLAGLSVQAQMGHTHNFSTTSPQLSAPSLMASPTGGGSQIYTSSIVSLYSMTGPMGDYDACTASGCTLQYFGGQPCAVSPIHRKRWESSRSGGDFGIWNGSTFTVSTDPQAIN